MWQWGEERWPQARDRAAGIEQTPTPGDLPGDSEEQGKSIPSLGRAGTPVLLQAPRGIAAVVVDAGMGQQRSAFRARGSSPCLPAALLALGGAELRSGMVCEEWSPELDGKAVSI